MVFFTQSRIFFYYCICFAGIAALFLVLVAAVCVLEGTKYVQAYLRHRMRHRMSQSPVCFDPVNDQSPLVQSLNLPPSLEHFKRIKYARIKTFLDIFPATVNKCNISSKFSQYSVVQGTRFAQPFKALGVWVTDE